jgi:hypothetical protein
MSTTSMVLAGVAAGLTALCCSAAQAQSAPLSTLAPANLERPRPAPPFDLTGMWQHNFDGPDSWRFVPETFELTPAAQVHYDAGERASEEGRLYRDDIGRSACSRSKRIPASIPPLDPATWPRHTTRPGTNTSSVAT